jgi:hypothetical protein
VLCLFSTAVQFFQNYVRNQFLLGSGTDRARKLAFSVLLSADRTNKVICQVVANSTSIKSSLLSPALTSSHIAFGQAKVAYAFPNWRRSWHSDAGITIRADAQFGAPRYQREVGSDERDHSSSRTMAFGESEDVSLRARINHSRSDSSARFFVIMKERALKKGTLSASQSSHV